MKKSGYSETVRRAAEQNGGYEKLAQRLGMNEAQVRAWGAGEAEPPTRVLLRLVDLVLEDTRAVRAARKTIFGRS